MYQLCRGIDHRQVEPEAPVKSLARNNIRKDSKDLEFLKSQLAVMAESRLRLRQQSFMPNSKY